MNPFGFGWPIDATKLALMNDCVGVNRECAGVYRTPQEKAKKVKAAKRNKAARKARKRNRR